MAVYADVAAQRRHVIVQHLCSICGIARDSKSCVMFTFYTFW